MTATLTPSTRRPRDQARGLRALIAAHAGQVPRTSHCRSLVITSGKGGVGKSVLALNLAVALAQRNQRVALLDASGGLAHLDLLCGLNGYWNLAHLVTGARRLEEVVLDGPGGVQVLTGGQSLADLLTTPTTVQQAIWQQLAEYEATCDYLIIDARVGEHRRVRSLVTAADAAYVVATPEPTAIADAYATIKGLTTADELTLHPLINRCPAASAEQILDRIETTADNFLHTSLGPGLHLPDDPLVALSVKQRRPFVLSLGEASLAVSRWAEWLVKQQPVSLGAGYFHRLARRWAPET